MNAGPVWSTSQYDLSEDNVSNPSPLILATKKSKSKPLKNKTKHNYKLLSRVNPNDLTRKLSIIQYCRVMLTVHGKSETGSSKRGGAPQYVQPFTVTKSSSELLLELTLDDFSRGSAEVPEQ